MNGFHKFWYDGMKSGILIQSNFPKFDLMDKVFLENVSQALQRSIQIRKSMWNIREGYKCGVMESMGSVKNVIEFLSLYTSFSKPFYLFVISTILNALSFPF